MDDDPLDPDPSPAPLPQGAPTVASTPANIAKLGPGTLTLGQTPFDFSCEVKGVSVTHSYDTEDNETMLCGDVIAGKSTRTDGLEVSMYNDLYDTGVYEYLNQHDMEETAFEFVPKTDYGTASPATWTGEITLTLPESIGAEEYGGQIASDVSWVGVGNFTFTPASDT